MKEKKNTKNVVYKKYNKTLRIMNTSIVMIFISVFNLLADFSYSQSEIISLKMTNINTIENVISELERTTDYVFIYNEDVVAALKNEVNVQVSNQTIDEILSQLLKGTDLTYSVASKQVTLYRDKSSKIKSNTSDTESLLVQQQNKKRITGTIVDEQGEPIIGANVIEKGTTNGTITDFDGNFTLNVSAGAVLRVSYIGYLEQELNTKDKKTIDVVLREDAEVLDEVVVVGYGVQKKAHVTGSVAQVDAEELMVTPMSNTTNLLAGKLPGLVARQNTGRPGRDNSNLIIRGHGTFNNSSPLLLVDGIERNFSSIDPSDVESITILKDAASAAVYGVRAAHGVILVKTKRGSIGKKPEISYTGSYTISKNTRFPKFLNGVDYAKWHNKARELDGNEGYYSESDIEKIANGDPDGIFGDTDWLDVLFKDHGSVHQHNLSVNGGSENAQYFVSGGFMNQDGIVPNSGFKRYNIRSNIDVNLSDEFKVTLDLSGRHSKENNPGFDIAPNNGYSPITQAIRVLPIINQEYEGVPTATGDGSSTWNPYEAAHSSGFNDVDRYIFESSAMLEYNAPFLKGLTARIFGSYDHNFTDQKNFLRAFHVAKFNPVSKDYVNVRADGTSEKSSLFQGSSNANKITLRPSIEYSTTIGKNSINALYLYEYGETNGRSFQASRRNFPLEDIIELPYAQEDVPNSISGGRTKTKVAGHVGRFNYNYDNKYLGEFSFRYDGSYKFHKDHRWGFFPSLSLGWVLSEEDFFNEKFDNIERLKIRMSIGELGKDNIGAFLYKRFFNLTGSPVYSFGEDPESTYALYSTNSVPSYDLSWEKTRTLNGGVEMIAWRGLLNVEFDVFYKYTYDILQSVSGLYPPSISDNYQTIENSGAVSSKGFELVLGHNNAVGDFIYNINGNVSWSRSKVLERTQADNTPSWKNIIGRPIGEIYGFKALGLYQTEEQQANRPLGPGGVQRLGDLMYEDINGDGKIDYYDQVRIARSPIPELFFGLNANLQWKNFDFYVQFQGAALCDVITSGLYPNGVMDQTEFARAFYAGGNSPYYLVEGSWTPENTDAKYPRLGEAWNGNNGWTSDWWVVDGSYLRLKQLSIGYTLPKNITSKFHAQKLRLYVSGSNLYTWDKLDYMDPEMPSNNNGYYPQQRTYSFGINLTF